MPEHSGTERLLGNPALSSPVETPKRRSKHVRYHHAWAAAVVVSVSCAWAADPALTIYNQDFAVVRDNVPIDLHAGSNEVHYSGATAHVEPDSVILRDASGKHPLIILDQNYRADPVTQEKLLSLFEGKTIEFIAGREPNGTPEMGFGQDHPKRVHTERCPQRVSIRAAYYRGQRKAAVHPARAAAVPRSRRRHDFEAHVGLDHPRAAPPRQVDS